jgi:hypothetical protein
MIMELYEILITINLLIEEYIHKKIIFKIYLIFIQKFIIKIVKITDCLVIYFFCYLYMESDYFFC